VGLVERGRGGPGDRRQKSLSRPGSATLAVQAVRMDGVLQFVVEGVSALIYGRGHRPRHAVQRGLLRGAALSLTAAAALLAVSGATIEGRALGLVLPWALIMTMLIPAEIELGDRRIGTAAPVACAAICIDLAV
jgi:hypothetical protein